MERVLAQRASQGRSGAVRSRQLDDGVADPTSVFGHNASADGPVDSRASEPRGVSCVRYRRRDRVRRGSTVRPTEEEAWYTVETLATSRDVKDIAVPGDERAGTGNVDSIDR